jgi:hypothetical protein
LPEALAAGGDFHDYEQIPHTPGHPSHNGTFVLAGRTRHRSWTLRPFARSRAEADICGRTRAIGNRTISTAITFTGRHALVLVDETQPVNTNPQQGIGIGLRQYGPTPPTTDGCPMVDFPGPTPAP